MKRPQGGVKTVCVGEFILEHKQAGSLLGNCVNYLAIKGTFDFRRALQIDKLTLERSAAIT